MSNNVKIVIGANYGDEGKGMMTRYFAQEGLAAAARTIVIFHNGTAQRGHTVDYTPKLRHVYHHFCSATADGVPTYYAKTFLLHPMTFRQEWMELLNEHLMPRGMKMLCDPECAVITPFDMAADHVTEAHIAMLNGEREFGSCGFGSWCATDRMPRLNYTIRDFWNHFTDIEYNEMMRQIKNECLSQLMLRGVDFDKIPEYRAYFTEGSEKYQIILEKFKADLKFFMAHTTAMTYENVWKAFTYHVFENGQGLGLDMNVGNKWHTTSNTGMTNPFAMLKDKPNFKAEVCYVTRSYLTRHGVGPLEEAVEKNQINTDMYDKTNVHNDFQGSLRYGYLEDDEQAARIIKDFTPIMGDNRFYYNMAITHCNEFPEVRLAAAYTSNNPFEVIKHS